MSVIYIWYPVAQAVLSYSQDAVAPFHFRVSICSNSSYSVAWSSLMVS